MENRDIFKLKGSKKIIVVTNRHLVKEGNFYSTIEKCAKFGADTIMLREKDLKYDELLKMAEKIKNITDRYGIGLIINGDFKVAVEIEACGFHTGFEKFRNMSRDEKGSMQIGVSIHSVNEALQAEKLGADYIMAGNIFETRCKPGLKGRGLEFISEILDKICIPVIAIGGIGPENIESVLKTGAGGAAVMSYAMKF